MNAPTITPPPMPPPKPLLDERVKYAAWVAVFVVLLICGTCVAIFGDSEDQAWVKDILIFVAGMAVPGSPLGAMFGRRVAPLIAGGLLALLLVGCAGMQIAPHRAAAAVTGIALSAGRSALDTVGGEVLASCAADEACENAAKARLDAARAAFDLADVARESYVAALEVAREVSEGDLWAALGAGAAALLVAYYRARAALCPLGVELPEPPGLLRTVVEWGSGAPLPEVPACELGGP